ncbi:MAG: phosphate acetyltransferase [Actinomycetes bacterium]
MTSLYIASAEPETGKSTVALGILEQLARRVGRVAVFRPIVRAGAQRDYVLEMLLRHGGVSVPYEQAAGVTYDDVHADGDAALAQIVERYHAIEGEHDAVVIVGSDYTDVGTPTEFSYNARIAANLGAPVLLIVRGTDRTAAEVRTFADMAVTELTANYGRLFGVLANRVVPSEVGAVRELLAASPLVRGAPVYALPDDPFLTAPTVADLMEACDGELVSGDPELLHREAMGLVVAGMTMPNVLARLFDDAVVITPGDRSDVVLGVFMAHQAQTFPSLAGVVINGGLPLHEEVSRLISGIGARLPIIATDEGTYDTTAALTAVRGRFTPDADRKIERALDLFHEHVDGDALLDRLDVAESDVVTPLMFEHQLLERARADRRHIVLPEGDEERILRAADLLLRRGVVELTLLGDPQLVTVKASQLGIDIKAAQLLDPHDPPLRDEFAAEYLRRRAHKGMTEQVAYDRVVDVSYFGTMMVELGHADGMVSGSAHTTAHTIRPALEVIRTAEGVDTVSSVFFMCLPDRVLVYGDCAIIPDPTAEQLADIAASSAATAEAFGVEPRVAMLSYSTGQSGKGADVEKVRAATELVRKRAPGLFVEGPIQYDAAVDAAVAATKLPGSQVAGRATVFIFPDLNTGNNTYKAVQRSAGAVAIGPVLQGLRKPVNDLSRGALVSDIVNTVAITAIQAQQLLSEQSAAGREQRTAVPNGAAVVTARDAS